MAAGFLSLTGCSDDDDNWVPGEKTEVVNQICFSNQDPAIVEVEPGEEKTYTLTLSREDATDAVSVPLVADGSSEFKVPATADFAAGEAETQITVKFAGAETSGNYNCKISIPDGEYNSPYTSLSTSIEIRLSIAKWELMAQGVKFTSTNGWLPDFSADLYKVDGQERYRFVELFTGQNLTFGLQEAQKSGRYNIFPEGGFNGIDAWETSTAWYFGKGSADEDFFKIYPKNYEGYYLFYCSIYTGDYYAGTYIDFNKKKGCIMMDYYVYEQSTDNYTGNGGYDYLNFNW